MRVHHSVDTSGTVPLDELRGMVLSVLADDLPHTRGELIECALERYSISYYDANAQTTSAVQGLLKNGSIVKLEKGVYRLAADTAKEADMAQNEMLLREIEAMRERLLGQVNEKMDELRNRILGGGELVGEACAAHEAVWPLTMMPEMFKGKKPAAVIFGEEHVPVKKWREVYTLILQRCDADAACHERLMGLRNRIHGRSRTILSDNPEGMDRPAEIRAGMYAEAAFDTGALIRMLTTGILVPAGYDYSGIAIALRA